MACNVLDPVQCAAQQAAKSGLEALASSFGQSAGWAVKTMTTAWMGAPSPDINEPGGAVAWLTMRVSYFVAIAAFLSVLYAAYRMATSGEFRHLGELGHSLFRLIAVATLTTALVAGMIEVGDLIADWMLNETPTFGLGVLLSGATSPGVVLVLAVVVILAQVIQLLIMLAKNAMIIALVAFIPVTGAATNTATGKAGFQRAVTWLAAAVLYKPVAAGIYALSFHLSGASTFAGQMSGVALMILAIFALPALMRLLVPVTAAAAGGNAGALAGATVGAAVATGAVIATGGGALAAGGFAGGGGVGAALASGAVPAAAGVGNAVRQQSEETTQ